MSLFHVVALVLTLVAFFGYLNCRLLKLPEPIGITAIGLAGSLVVVAAGALDPALTDWAKEAIGSIDFSKIVFHGLLGLLLFAGSLHVDWSDIGGEKWTIVALATVGVALSATLVGAGFYYAGRVLGFELPFVQCLLFGALISPTDPIAVLGLLRRLGVATHLETKITGESLFNDGMGVVLFIGIFTVATAGHSVSVSEAAMLFATEVVGGIVIGLAIGAVGLFLLKGVDSYAVEILITLSMATGGYALADSLHTSAPIAVVMMGLLVANQGKRYTMSERTRQHLFSFWELIDELLNLLLFGLIGLEFVTLEPVLATLAPGLVAVPIVLLARWASVRISIAVLSRFRDYAPETVAIMTWGGLRGGISVALALSLPAEMGRETIVAATYGVVIFSILVQALTLPRLARHLEAKAAHRPLLRS